MTGFDWEDILDLVADGRAALAEPDIRRPRACMIVLPKIVDALERAGLYKVEILSVKADLATVVKDLREAVVKATASHFDVPGRAKEVKQALNQVPPILDRLDRLVYGDP